MESDEELKYQLVDVTEQFIAECQALGPSNFLKDENFKLADAVSAIVLCDPKMDTGMNYIEKKLDKFLSSLEEILLELTIADTIAIFDGTIAMLMSWINAQPLDLTVYTNLCLLNPTILEGNNPHLYAISCSLLYAVNLIKFYITTASVGSEEDICLATRATLVELDAETVNRLLNNSIKTIKKAKKENKDLSAEFDALSLRFTFMLELFEFFHYLLPPLNILATTTNSAQQNGGEGGGTVIERFVPDRKKAKASLGKCINSVKRIAATVGIGSRPPAVEGIHNGDSNEGDSDFAWLPVFDNNAYLYISPPSFQRKPKLFSRIESLEFIEQLFNSILQILDILPDPIDTTCTIIHLLKRFGNEGSSIFVRSILQLILMPNDHIICERQPLGDIIITSLNYSSGLIEGVAQSLELAQAGDPSVKNVLNGFLALTTRAFFGIFQTLGSNLARQREKHLRANFEDLGILMHEASSVELDLEMARLKLVDENSKADPASPPTASPSIQHLFSNFLLYTVLDLMHYHFSLGFQLRLFLPYEFLYIYWYFGEIVTRTLMNLMEQICNTLIIEFSKSPVHQQKKLTGKKLQQKNKMEKEFQKRVATIKTRAKFYRIDAILSQAMFRLMSGLVASDRIAVPPGERIRYSKRFEIFSTLPSMLYYNYDDFLRESRIGEMVNVCTAEDHFSEAARLFGQAIFIMKDVKFDEKADDTNSEAELLESLQKTAKQNKVAANLLGTSKLNKKIYFEFASSRDDRGHQQQQNFPLIKIL